MHMKQLYSLHKRAVKVLMPIPNLDYKQKCCALKLLPLEKQLLLSKCVLMQMVVHGKPPQYLKDFMIPSERLHVHGNKQLLPRTRTHIFKTSFSFSGSLAWNSLALHLRYPIEFKTFQRKAFQALAKPLWYFYFIFLFYFFYFLARQTTSHKMYRILLFSFPCSCKVLDLYFINFFISVFSSNIYSFSLSRAHQFCCFLLLFLFCGFCFWYLFQLCIYYMLVCVCVLCFDFG